jgi:hypothetical protein
VRYSHKCRRDVLIIERNYNGMDRWQLAGSYYGVEGTPADLLEKLTEREMIAGFAQELHKVCVS